MKHILFAVMAAMTFSSMAGAAEERGQCSIFNPLANDH